MKSENFLSVPAWLHPRTKAKHFSLVLKEHLGSTLSTHEGFAGLPVFYLIDSKLTKLQVYDFPWTTGLFIISICPMMTSWLQYYISVWILNILVFLFALELYHFKIKISFHLLLWDTSVAIANHPQNVDGKFFTCLVDSMYQKRRGKGRGRRGRVITEHK